MGLVVLGCLPACGGDDPETPKGGTTTGDPPEPRTVVDLAVDANRSGGIDEGDADREDVWDATVGASFLANVDDDDGDKVRDGDDDYVNGGNDINDLQLILVYGWPEAPDGSTGRLTLDDAALSHVRIFKQGPDGAWALVAGSVGPCSEANPTCQLVNNATLTVEEVRTGVNFAIEGRGFVMSLDEGEWTGQVQLGYSIIDEKGAPVITEEVPDGVDRAVMKVAPWIMTGNLTPGIDTVYSSTASSVFVKGLTTATDKGGVFYNKIPDSSAGWTDQWTQDYFQTGWTSIPGPDGTVKGMRIGNPRPWGRSNSDSALPINWLNKAFLGPDRGVITVYKVPHTGSSYDSHGNHEMLPPYENNGESFPVGRIFHGSGILKETKAFYAAQQVQGPPLIVDTSWLIVGHTDEVFSSIRANTPRGWKLLVGSPRLARQMLEDAQAAGHGDELMFAAKPSYAVTIDEVLADTDIMAWSQQGQNEIDENLPIVKAATGLTDDEIVEIPFLFEADGGLVAFNPGTLNLLAFGEQLGIPDPFGPKINGVDMFQQQLIDELGSPGTGFGSDGNGLEITFVDDWSTYHILLGEVHCGSNIDNPPPADQKWWEVVR